MTTIRITKNVLSYKKDQLIQCTEAEANIFVLLEIGEIVSNTQHNNKQIGEDQTIKKTRRTNNKKKS